MPSIESMIKRLGEGEDTLSTDRIMGLAEKRQRRRSEMRLVFSSAAISCVVVLAMLGLVRIVNNPVDEVAARPAEAEPAGGTASGDLFDAVRADDHELVRELMDMGIDPEQRTRNGQLTPLMVAAHRNSVPVVQVLLDFQADPLLANQFGESSFEIAARAGSAEVFTRMAETVEPSAELLGKSLLSASRAGDVETVKVILDLGVDLEEYGAKALELSATNEANGADISRLLVEAGASA